LCLFKKLPGFPPVNPEMEYATLRTDIAEHIVRVTIDNPPINLLDAPLRADLDLFSRELEKHPEVRVVVFDSANPDFFIAHADVNLILARDDVPPPKSLSLNWIHTLGERLRRMPKVTIAKIEGRARGGGSEFALNLDMRFAAIGKAVFAQPEVALGIIPGGGATQRLPRLLGPGRALEVILGCDDYDAETAERYGWINRALPADELSEFVDRLARRIAAFSETAVAQAKLAIHAAEPDPFPGLLEEAHCFDQAVTNPRARRGMQRFLDDGGQTAAYELNLGDRLDRLNVSDDKESR
jgi:enoyl-CoA hydratase/carnithine racemase